MKRTIAWLLCLCMLLTGSVCLAESSSTSLDLAAALDSGAYAWEKSEDGGYYSLKNVVYVANPVTAVPVTQFPGGPVVSDTYEYMHIYVPAAYFEAGEVNGYTRETAPVVFENNCSGWNSSAARDANEEYLAAGFVFISCGARSRDAYVTSEDGTTISYGKAPTAVVDLKAAIRFLRLNREALYGDTEKIISIGMSGGGQMSALLGASGDMAEYYPALYEIGAAGIEKNADGTYTSTISDAVYAMQAYCPITDIANADLAYSWMRYDSHENDPARFAYTPFQLALDEVEAQAFCAYINSLNLKTKEGNALAFLQKEDGTFETRGDSSYYQQMLQNITDALNAFYKNNTWPYAMSVKVVEDNGQGGMPGQGGPGGQGGLPGQNAQNGQGGPGAQGGLPEQGGPRTQGGPGAGGPPPKKTVTTVYDTMTDYLATLSNDHAWYEYDEEADLYRVTDLAAFCLDTNLARGKDIPGYDTMKLDAENNAFGADDVYAVHFSQNLAKAMRDNYDALAALATEGEKTAMDEWLTIIEDEALARQVYLSNPTDILLHVATGEQEAHPAKYWRTRSGTADADAGFSLAYDLALAANAAGCDADYALVWAMGHSNEEGTSTGTFVDWVDSICK